MGEIVLSRSVFSFRDESNWVQVRGGQFWRFHMQFHFSYSGSCVVVCGTSAWSAMGSIVSWSGTKYDYNWLVWPSNIFPLCLSFISMVWALLIAWFSRGYSISVVVSGSCKETCAFLVTPNDLDGRGVGVLLCWPVDNCVWWLVHCFDRLHLWRGGVGRSINQWQNPHWVLFLTLGQAWLSVKLPFRKLGWTGYFEVLMEVGSVSEHQVVPKRFWVKGGVIDEWG